jgi:hypothetical protein
MTRSFSTHPSSLLIRSGDNRPIWEPKGDKFLKGPVPLVWLSAAHRLGHASFTVGIECWHLAGLNRSRAFRLNLSRLRVAPAMARSSARRGLARLEKAGLVTVARPAGQRVVVALILPEAQNGNER